MSIFYLDASAWVKYYTVEPGSDWVERFWQLRLPCACSELGPVEVLSALVRRRRQTLSPIGSVEEMLADVDRQFQAFQAIPLNPAVLALSRGIVVRRALRSADSIHLASALHLRQTLGDPPVLIASDLELLAAARAEGLIVLDPTSDPPLPSI